MANMDNMTCLLNETGEPDKITLLPFWAFNELTFIAACGMLTNLVNISVFLNPKLKEKSYSYMLATSVSNFFYLSLLFVAHMFIFCLCSVGESYFAAVYVIIIVDYLTSSLAVFRICVEIMLTFHTYCILAYKKRIESISHRLIIVTLFLLSLVYYSPVLFLKNINENIHPDGSVTYSPDLNPFGQSLASQVIIVTLQAIRLILENVVLAFMNFLTIIKFRQRFLQRKIVQINFKMASNALSDVNGNQKKQFASSFLY
jgi:hypothetical protein